jgi:hypothetical protein
MTTQILLSVPDTVYQQAEQIAQEEARPVGDVLNDALVQVFSAVHVSEERTLMQAQEAAFRTMHSELLHQFMGQHIAFCDGEVLDHDVDRIALLNRLDRDYPDRLVLVKQVLAEPERIFYIPSNRMLRT